MNIGDYVRTKKGIAKIIDKLDNERFSYPGAWVTDTYLEIYDDTKYIYDEGIIKSSPQIIDLIEYMDMLYLKKPIKIYGTNKTVKLFNPVRCDGFTTYDDGTHCIILDLDHIVDVNDLEIEAVVTHEQMEAMQYRVEE